MKSKFMRGKYVFLVVSNLVMFINSCYSQKQFEAGHLKAIEATKASFVNVQGGVFRMGNDFHSNTSPVHTVKLDSYSINKYETTFEEYDLYAELNNLEKIKPELRNKKGYGSNSGVMHVNWYQSRGYCIWLGKQLNLSIDLPTEAQWEYAARSRGLDVDHATDNGKLKWGKKDRNYGIYRVVGEYPPNPLGLYDMSGGRPEWVLDWYVDYDKKELKNPIFDSLSSSNKRVIRGHHSSISAYFRISGKPSKDKKGVGIGFRCVCNQQISIN